MPANDKIALHSDFTVEQHDEIKKEIRVIGKKESFWYQLCQHDKMPKADTLKYRHQILIDPEAVHVLTENVTPDPTSVAAVQFEVSAFNIGSWFKYSRESLELNKDSIVGMGTAQLAHERLYDLETIRGNAYRGTTCAITKAQNETWTHFLLRVKTQLKKNKAKPIKGNDYLMAAPGEILNDITESLGDLLKAVPAGEQMILDGVVGRALGFQFIENDEDYMYQRTPASGNDPAVDKAVCLFIGKNRFGEFPVVERSYSGTNDHVGGEGANPSKADPMGNWGFISSRVDGVCAVLADEGCVIKFAPEITYIEPDIPAATFAKITSQGGLKLKQVKVKAKANAQTGINEDIKVETSESKVEAEYDD